jgi:hypothetical protein
MIEAPPYIEYADFPRLTPFTEQAIRAAVSRKELKEGVHFFRRGRRVIFKWAAIEAWIERRMIGEHVEEPADIVPIRSRA